MRNFPLHKAIGLGLLAYAFSAGGASAQTATTSPVGFNSVTCLGASDTYTSIPFTRTPAYAAAISAAPAGNIVTFTGTPFVASQYKYVQGTQSDTFYLYILSGPKEGSFYTIIDNTANSVTVDLSGDSISSVTATTSIQIVPYWTLNTAFPNGQGTNTSASFSNPPTKVITPDQTTAGKNLASPNNYFYYTGSGSGGPGWRRTGSPFASIFNDVILYPDTYFIVRNTGATTTFTPVGSVSTISTPVSVNSQLTNAVNVSTVLGTLASNVDQDNAIALPVPTTASLLGSNLFQSGAFTGSSTFTPVDQLLIYDNTIAALNKAPSKIYFYYTGTASGGAGWRQTGQPFANIKDTDTPFQPGTGFIIRKKAGAVQSVAWNYRPIYVP